MACVVAVAGCNKHKSAPTPATTTASAAAATASPPSSPPAAHPAPAEGVQAFLGWVGANHTAPEKAPTDRECYGPGDSDAGWCLGTTSVSAGSRYVKWRKADASVAKFESAALPRGLQLSCASLDATRIRKWRWASADSTLFHCKFTGGALAGWHAWVKLAPVGTYLRVFSASYLKADTAFANTLANQGETLP